MVDSVILLPLARSSAISKSFSFVADMERYSACEYRFDCRAERPSLWEDTVFCREMGSWEVEEFVDSRDR